MAGGMDTAELVCRTLIGFLTSGRLNLGSLPPVWGWWVCVPEDFWTKWLPDEMSRHDCTRFVGRRPREARTAGLMELLSLTRFQWINQWNWRLDCPIRQKSPLFPPWTFGLQPTQQFRCRTGCYIREDVCCIVGKAALGEMLSNVECVVAHDYFVLLAVSIYSSVGRFGQGFGLWLRSRRKCFRMLARRDTGPLCLDISWPVHKI